ncbi:MAG: tetratricopeptide repeat protein [Planctomycetota bacterium]
MRARLATCLVLAAVPTSASCGWTGVDPPPVAEITAPEDIDPDVVALARKTAAAARLDPDNAELRADLALVFEANEIWYEAVRAWHAALFLAPDQTLWRFHYSLCLRRQGDDPNARIELRRVVAEAPDLPAARFAFGEMLLDADDLAGAQAEFEAAMRLAPTAPDIHAALAEVMIRRQDHARAVELCQRAIALDPAGKRAHYALGLAYRGLGRIEEAEIELTRGQNSVKRTLSDPLSPRLEPFRVSFSLRFNRAMTLDGRGDTAAAVQIFEQLLRTHPNDVKLLNNLAAAYTELGRAEAAYPLLLRSRDLKPDEFATYINLAAADILRKDYAKALDSANRAVELAPTLARARFTRAAVYMETGRLEEAYADLKLATDYDASSGDIFGRLGHVAMQTGRLREAVTSFEKAVNLMPDSLAAQASLARSYFKTGERQKALAAFDRALKLAPNHPELRTLGAEIGAPPR